MNARIDGKVEVADIFDLYGDQYLSRYKLSSEQAKSFNLIKVCRTRALGGHMQQCDFCGVQVPAYNSCRNRHCPKCQSSAKQKWLNARSAELLPCGYFHLVFTLPHELNGLIWANKSLLMGQLFAQVNKLLQRFAEDPQWRLKGKLGYLAILHTWSQTLIDHCHLHCLVPAGVLRSDEKQWIASRRKYLFDVKALGKSLRHHYLKSLEELFAAGKLRFPGQIAQLARADRFAELKARLKGKKWIVYAKRPFAGPQQILDYLGRYTHRVAISNYRITGAEDGKVRFTYRDRSGNNELKYMTLDAVEFIRRFLLHVLPNGFVKIRYFGFMAHRNRKRCIALIRELIGPEASVEQTSPETVAEMMLRVTGIDITLCPNCGKGHLKRFNKFAGVPAHRARDPTE